MSAEDDALREMAANRGCKLVRSRRRKPGGDFGRYGLKDAKTGKEVLGFGARGLTATAEEVQSFLRGDAVAGWKRSLIAPVGKHPAPAKRRRPEPPPEKAPAKRKRAEPPPKKGKRAKAPRASKKASTKRKPAKTVPKPQADKRAARAKRPEPEPPKPPKLREAKPRDAGAIAALLDELGYEVGAADVRRRLQAMRKAGTPALVADRDREVIGCLTWHVTPVLHRPRPVGRITMLVVAEPERGGGLGTALVAAAETRLRERGCGLVEVTSNMKRMRAHAFYQGLGYERTSYRFAKTLEE